MKRRTSVETAEPNHRSGSDSVADLQRVMRQIDDRLDEVAAAVPPRHRSLVPNALLNLAVERMLSGQSAEFVATTLYRLASLIAEGKRPAGCDAFPLTGHDA